MSKQNKYAGNFGKVDRASGGSSVKGSNVYKPVPKAPAPKSGSSKSDNVITRKTGPGDNMGTQTISTNNSISAFTRGIKSRGPYGGPSFSSFNSYGQNARRSDTRSISKFSTPTGGSSSRGTAGGSGKGMTSNSKVGRGQAVASRGKLSRKVQSGSGHQSGLGRKRA